MALKGKILVRHLLNKKLYNAKYGNYPLYVLIVLKRKNVQIKSRSIFFSDEVVIDPNIIPGEKREDFLSEHSYVSEEDFDIIKSNGLSATLEKTSEKLDLLNSIHKEREYILKVGEFYKEHDINFIEHEPSKILDRAIGLVNTVTSGDFNFTLNTNLHKVKNYKLYLLVISMQLDFKTKYELLRDYGNRDVQELIIEPFRFLYDISSILELPHFKKLRLIDWLTNSNWHKKLANALKEKGYSNELAQVVIDQIDKEIKSVFGNISTPYQLPQQGIVPRDWGKILLKKATI